MGVCVCACDGGEGELARFKFQKGMDLGGKVPGGFVLFWR